MQDNFLFVVLLVATCFFGITITQDFDINPIKPIPDSEKLSNLVIHPNLIFLPKRCGFMGIPCKNASDCCKWYSCDYAIGYDSDDSSTKCCGGEGATGCTMIQGAHGKGCCSRHYCTWADQYKKKNCM